VTSASGGATEQTPPAPIGDYAASCLSREEVFAAAAAEHGNPVALIRLNYAVEFRYGLLVDIAQRVLAHQPVDVTMGYVNVIWQTDAVAHSIQALEFAIISSARVVSQNVAYEIPMLLVVITLLMVTGTMDLQEIIKQQAGGFWHWNVFKVWVNPLMPVTFLIFFICMLAETNRAPFDMAEAESELVAGAFTEYGGMGFGVFFMAEYANIVVGCCLATILFLGGWQSPIGVLSGGLWGPVWFLGKMYALIFTVIWIRWTFPRTQFYSLLNLSWKILIPISLFTLLLTGAMMKLPLVWNNFF
jgi:formate hydrogenlyase subunit 4